MSDIESAEGLEDLFHHWLNERPASSATETLELEFAGQNVACTFHGPELASIYGRAVKHRRTSPSNAPGATVHVFAGDTTGLGLPRMGWKPADFGRKRTMPGWSDRIRTTLFLRTERGVAVFNHRTSVGYVWLPGAGTVPWWEYAAPMRWLNDLIAVRFGKAAIHAAAVGKAGKGVLIAGGGGVGKSTLALACLGRGLDFAGDDYCVAEPGPVPDCHTLYNTAKWSRDARALPEWVANAAREAVDRTKPKEIIHVDECLPERMAGRLALEGIIIPRQTGGSKPRLESCDPGTTLRALAPSTLAQSEADGRQVMTVLSGLVHALPGYVFHMPSSPDVCGAYLADNLDRIG